VDVLAGLNPEQRRAAEAVRGPVCILAGAGSGKTTTITHRIAHQVGTEAFRPGEILAVTFTDKAAGELRARLERLGAPGVTARTFHAAALAQLHRFAPERVGKLVPSKALPLRHLVRSLPGAYRFRPLADVATEIEWAKNRRIPPERYRSELGDHEPPLPPDLMHRIYVRYEAGKRAKGFVDFEDLLELAIRTYEEDDQALALFRERYRAFTVDEYQDVNLLQQTLLDLWLGARDDLCVVGDDYQSIYAFTGASPEHLLGMPSRFPNATVVRLEANYRSTPQVLELANRLVPRLGGAEKTLRPTRPDGPEPELVQASDEGAFVVERIRELDVQREEIAVLCRTNARLTTSRAHWRPRGSRIKGRRSSPATLRGSYYGSSAPQLTSGGSRWMRAGRRASTTASASASSCGSATSDGSLPSPRSSRSSTGPPSSRSWNGASAMAASHAAESIC
jgi:DNA helicase II / ATP-dependent DNA helicase PcrA